MSADPWWHSHPDDPQAQAAVAAVQETLAGGLSLVAAMLRSFDGAGTPGTDEAPPTPHHDGPECRSCPVCQVLALLRETSPDLLDGLGDTLEALTATVRSFTRPTA